MALATPTPPPPLAACTKAVVANCVVLVPTDAVGAVGVPVKAGDTARTQLPVPVTAVKPAYSVFQEAASVPLVAGIFAMPFWTFQIANFSSAFLWAGVLLTPGIFGGKFLDWLN